MHRFAFLRPFCEQIEQLFCHERARVSLLKSSSSSHNIVCCVRSLDSSISRSVPPVLYCFYFFVVQGIFGGTGFGLGRKELE